MVQKRVHAHACREVKQKQKETVITSGTLKTRAIHASLLEQQDTTAVLDECLVLT